jgi:hypothetical protein
MISQNKKTNTKKVLDNSIKSKLSKSGLPTAYQRLLRLIFISPDRLIHKASFHDKVSS